VTVTGDPLAALAAAVWDAAGTGPDADLDRAAAAISAGAAALGWGG
jgi:hypothetical protein